MIRLLRKEKPLKSLVTNDRECGVKTKTTREQYEAFVESAIELVNCSDCLKEIKKDYDGFIDLVATRMVAMGRNYYGHLPVTDNYMQQGISILESFFVETMNMKKAKKSSKELLC